MRPLLLLLALLIGPAARAGDAVRFTILHTNDLHSQLEGTGPDRYFTPAAGDGDPVKGHYARLAHAIRQLKAERAAAGVPVLTVDAGDFFGGTLFQVLGPSPKTPEAPELAFFSDLGYDAVGLGNHEFDPGEAGLARMLAKRRPLGLHVPLVASNAVPESAFGLPLRRIVELHAGSRILRVGVLAYVGPDAALVSAANRAKVGFVGFDDAKSKMQLDDLVALARTQVRQLREHDKVDVIVVLLHGGHPEDQRLAGDVPGIDVLVAGHSHESYDLIVGQTVIAQAGSFGQALGIMDLEYKDGHVRPVGPGAVRRLPIDDSVPADADYLAKIAGYKREVSKVLGAEFGKELPRYDDPVVTVTCDWPRTQRTNAPLGRLVTSDLLSELNRHVASPVDVYFTSMSLVRTPFLTRAGRPAIYQLSDVYRMMPIGFGPNGTPGYPITTFYLTPKELKTVIEFTELYSHVSANFAAIFSDTLSFRIRPWGIPFLGRIADPRLHGAPLEDHQGLIAVATNEFVARYFAKLPALSHGLLDVRPKDREGHVLKDVAGDPKLPREFELLAASLRRHGLTCPKP